MENGAHTSRQLSPPPHSLAGIYAARRLFINVKTHGRTYSRTGFSTFPAGTIGILAKQVLVYTDKAATTKCIRTPCNEPPVHRHSGYKHSSAAITRMGHRNIMLSGTRNRRRTAATNKTGKQLSHAPLHRCRHKMPRRIHLTSPHTAFPLLLRNTKMPLLPHWPLPHAERAEAACTTNQQQMKLKTAIITILLTAIIMPAVAGVVVGAARPDIYLPILNGKRRKSNNNIVARTRVSRHSRCRRNRVKRKRRSHRNTGHIIIRTWKIQPPHPTTDERL